MLIFHYRRKRIAFVKPKKVTAYFWYKTVTFYNFAILIQYNRIHSLDQIDHAAPADQ